MKVSQIVCSDAHLQIGRSCHYAGILSFGRHLYFSGWLERSERRSLAALTFWSEFSLVLSILSMAVRIGVRYVVARSWAKAIPAGAAQWGWDSGKLGFLLITLWIPLVLFPKFFLSIFLSTPQTIEIRRHTCTADSTAGLASLIYVLLHFG